MTLSVQLTQPQTMETIQLGTPGIEVPRLWVGLWQLSSGAWGTAPASKIRKAMQKHVEDGYTAFADHYGSAEILFGKFRESHPSARDIVGATKWCVFRPIRPTRQLVEEAIKERLSRMRTDHVDLLQFHWNDYSDSSYLIALHHLKELQAEGRIRLLGLCNFDAIRTDEICTRLGPGSIVTNQVQFSLIDTRPLHGMSHVCENHNIKLLTYGTLCGGFLSDKWLGEPEPDSYQIAMTPSQRKYLEMIVKAWGSWSLFQTLLAVLRTIGDRHNNVSIANVATRWILDFPFVGAVLVGSRLGISDHIEDNHRVFTFRLSEQDRADINKVLNTSNGHKLVRSIGDCGAEYR